MKTKHIFATVGVIVTGYITAVVTDLFPFPTKLTCSSFSLFCETDFIVPCNGRVNAQNPTFDCTFRIVENTNVSIIAGETVSDATYTMIFLTQEQALSNTQLAVPECEKVPYPRLDCSSGFGRGQKIRPLPFNQESGTYVMRIALRDSPTEFTAGIQSKPL